jgi:hypothetical protein
VPDEVRAQTSERIAGLQTLSRQTFGRWIDRFEISPKRLRMPSR